MCISPYFQVVTERTELRHGDRILWGNNHFFRINCPHHIAAGQQTTKTEEKKIDFDFAQVMDVHTLTYWSSFTLGRLILWSCPIKYFRQFIQI